MREFNIHVPNYRECQILLLYKYVCSEWNVYNVSVQVYSFIINKRN